MDAFWTAFWLLLIWIPLVTLWVFGLTDIFRRIDMTGLAKVLWVLVIIYLPVIGMVIYYTARPAVAQYRQSDHGHAAKPTAAQQLHTLADLHDRGKLTDEEYAEQKRVVIATP